MKNHSQKKQLLVWLGALALGTLLGLVPGTLLHQSVDFIATVYIRLFQLLAVPTIFLAVINTMIRFGLEKETGRIFRHAVTYTLLTTFAAALLGLVLYNIIQPDNLPLTMLNQGSSALPETVEKETYYEHVIGVIPNNLVQPFLDSNVLSILLLAFAIGIGIAKLPKKESTVAVVRLMEGLQDLLFLLIHCLIWTLPLGIVLSLHNCRLRLVRVLPSNRWVSTSQSYLEAIYFNFLLFFRCFFSVAVSIPCVCWGRCRLRY